MSILRSLYKNRRKGFTLMETMVTVGIVVVLLGIAIPSIVAVKRSLSFRELDNSARTVYLAAQSNLAALRRDGELATLAEADGARAVPERDNAGMTEGDWSETLRYTVSGTAAFDLLLPANTVDSQLRGGRMLIEYDLVSGYVYSVFYSEGEESLSYDSISREEDARKKLKLGYYCGGVVAVAAAEENSSDVTLTADPDGEELILSLRVDVPESYTEHQDVFYDHISASVILRGETSGKEYTLSAELKKELCIGSPNYIEFTYVLDSLNADYGIRALKNDKGETIFTLGENLSFEAAVQFEAPEGYTLLRYDDVLLTGVNSLFSRVVKSGETYKIELTNGRHLQNLNELDADIANKVTIVCLTKDINWRETAEYYTGAYVRNNAEGEAESAGYKLFTPLNMSKFTDENMTFDGQKKEILYLNIDVTEKKYSSGDVKNPIEAGLFGRCSISVRDLALVSPIVKGDGDAGALAGAVVNQPTFENCSVYIDTKDDGFSRDLLDECGVSGRRAGGLVGYAAGTGATFNGCFAAVDVTGTETAGGLVGSTTNGSFTQCYASGSVTGATAGGFVGMSMDSTYTKCFASGGVHANATTGCAGGFVGDLSKRVSDKLTFSECYAVGVVDGEDGATRDGFCGTGLTLPTGETDKEYFKDKVYKDTYYWNRTTGDKSLCAEAVGYADLMFDATKTKQLLDGWREAKETHAYSLTAQGGYPFVVYGEAVEYYGDWPELLGSAVLAYYEQYKDDGDSETEEIGYYILSEESSTLQNDRTIVADGYVLLAQGDAYQENGTTKLDAWPESGDKQAEFRGYKAYKLPTPTGTDFYRSLAVKVTVKTDETSSKEETYNFFYNPDFALTQLNPSYKADGTQDKAPTKPTGAPGKIYIRTARQLAALAKTEYSGKAYNYVQYVQLLDVDFTTYGTTSITATAQTINSFAGTYTGSEGYVEQAKIVMKDGVSLFGRVSGTVEDVLVNYENNAPNGNALARTVSGKLTNCDVRISGATAAPIGTVEKTGTVTGCDVIAASFSGASAGFVDVNYGTISECTVAPANDSDAKQTTGVTYGFAEKNHGTITNCMANTVAAAAAFVGENTGSIRSCYAWYSGTPETDEEKQETGETLLVFAENNTGSIVSSYAGIYATDDAPAYALVYDRAGKVTVRDTWDNATIPLGSDWYYYASANGRYPYCIPHGIEHRGGWDEFGKLKGTEVSYTGYYYYEVYDGDETSEASIGVYIVMPDDPKTEENEAKTISLLDGSKPITATGYGTFTMTETPTAEEPSVVSLDGAPTVPSELGNEVAITESLNEAFQEELKKEGVTRSFTFKKLGLNSVYVLNGTEINTSFAPKTEDGAYAIRTGEQFAAMASDPAGHFVQQRDIEVSAPLGGFAGEYDGDEYSIAYTGKDHGLFGKLTGTVKNVVMEGVALSALPENNAGVTVGVLADTTGEDALVRNCRVVSPVIAVVETAGTGRNLNITAVIGGLVGENHGCIETCSVENLTVTYTEAGIEETVTISYTANYTVGGLVGLMADGSMSESFATGEIGKADTEKELNSFTAAEGETVILGGAVGAEDAEKNSRATYTDCYAAVTIYGKNATVGSFAGAVQDGHFSACGGWGGDAWTGTTENADTKLTLTNCYYYNSVDSDITLMQATASDGAITGASVDDCADVPALVKLLNANGAAVWSAKTTKVNDNGSTGVTHDTKYPVLAGRYDAAAVLAEGEAITFQPVTEEAALVALEAEAPLAEESTATSDEPEETTETATEETTEETTESEETTETEATPEPTPEPEAEMTSAEETTEETPVPAAEMPAGEE